MKCLTSILLLLCCLSQLHNIASAYKIGLGRGDCTGPPVEIIFMGYAQLGQRGEGIHLRQFARSFIVQDDDAPDRSRIVYVTVEAGMMGHDIRHDVIKKLQKKYGDLYRYDNVMISGTHTHSAPGGFLMDLLYHLPTLGFVQETYYALVRGIVRSVDRAHKNLQSGSIRIGETIVMNANINRSPVSYLKNPESERSLYEHDVDKTLTQLQFFNSTDHMIGAFNWFPVHPVSMNNTNHYVSTDNVGLAALLVEEYMNPDSLPGRGDFVGAFGSTNLGDVSPNIMGPKCELTGDPCDVLTSSCPTGHGTCFASGPGHNMYESTKIIGTRIANGAKTLLNNPGKEVTGPIRNIHQFVDMTKLKTRYYNAETNETIIVKGCYPAMGQAFAAGTTDGPGAFDFKQGPHSGNPLWSRVFSFLTRATAEDITCHEPKPILLATGRAGPYEWQPKIVPLQVFQIGNVIMTGVPGEYTTMSGRRLKRHLKELVKEIVDKDVDVIVAGLSNIYSSYIATPEEYQLQRYEAASTIFGPHTQTVQMARFKKLVTLMVLDNKTEPGPSPPTSPVNMFALNPPVYFDWHPLGRYFGAVIREPRGQYSPGETVKVTFTAANPRNDLRHEDSYFTVEQLIPDQAWKVVRTDANWSTKFHWRRTNVFLAHSEIDFYWNIEQETPPGKYRIWHFGGYKQLLNDVVHYDGCTMEFEIVN